MQGTSKSGLSLALPKDWTEGRYNSFITSVLRAGVRKWPNKWKALELACSGPGINEATGRKAKLYTCASCARLFTAKGVEVDHIEPVVDPKTGFTTWDNYISRLFCSTDNLQVLCKPCHKLKTLSEKKSRTSPAKKLVRKSLKCTQKRPTSMPSPHSPSSSKASVSVPKSGKTSTRKPKR